MLVFCFVFAAQQLTLYDLKLFQDVQPVEFINHLVADKFEGQSHGGTFTPHLQRFIRRFDQEVRLGGCDKPGRCSPWNYYAPELLGGRGDCPARRAQKAGAND
jgi:hypothetical protein